MIFWFLCHTDWLIVNTLLWQYSWLSTQSRSLFHSSFTKIGNTFTLKNYMDWIPKHNCLAYCYLHYFPISCFQIIHELPDTDTHNSTLWFSVVQWLLVLTHTTSHNPSISFLISCRMNDNMYCVLFNFSIFHS